MLLPPEDAGEFLSHYQELIVLVSGSTPADTLGWVDARDDLLTQWSEFEVDEKLAANPLYQALPLAVHGRFCFLKRYKEYCAMRHMESGQFYAVYSLTTALEEMLPEYSVVQTCLLPFSGVVVCDGLVRSENVLLGKNMAKGTREAYWEAKRSGALIQEIPLRPDSDKLLEGGGYEESQVQSLTDHPVSHARLKQLRSYSRDELAVLLNDLADEHQEVHDRVNLFLKRDDMKELASELRDSISKIENSTGFIDYYASDGAASQLHDILSVVERDLIPVEPMTALEVLHYFIGTDAEIIGNADDSNGSIADAYHRACELLGAASLAAGKPKQAEEIFMDLHDANDYGTRDRLFDAAVNILSEVALARLIAEWRKRAACEDPKAYGGIRIRLAQVAESIDDPELHEEATLCGRPIDDFPLLALDVAKVYLNCGKPEIALSKIPHEEACRHFHERSEVLLAIHRELGDQKQLAAEFLKLFQATGSAGYAKKYLENIPEEDQPEALRRLNATMCEASHGALVKAGYFAEMDQLGSAAEVVEQNADDLGGEFYSGVLDLIELFGDAFPLARSVLYRVNLDSILERGVSKYYRHAVRYARKLDKLAEQVDDWKCIPTHQAYWLGVQEKHKRKSSFWKQYGDV